MVPDEESLGCPGGFSLGDHHCGRGCSLGSPTLCVSIFDSTSPQMAEKQQNEAKEAAATAATQQRHLDLRPLANRNLNQIVDKPLPTQRRSVSNQRPDEAIKARGK